MDVLPRVVEEAVGGARIDLHLPGLPELLERLLEPLDVVPGDPDVRVAVDVEDRAGQVLERGLVGDLAIVGRGGPDVLAAAGEQERVGAAHAEAGDSDAIPPDLLHAPEVRDGAQQVLDGVLAAEGPHQLAGLVGIRRDLAVVEVRGEGHVPFARVPLGHVLDVVVEPPPLLDHDHRRRRPRALRLRQIRPDPVPVPHELDRVAHYGPSFLILTATTRRSSASRTVMWNRPTLNSSHPPPPPGAPGRRGQNPPGPRLVAAGGKPPFEALVDLLDAAPAGDAIAPVGQPLDRRRGRLPLVPDLPN